MNTALNQRGDTVSERRTLVQDTRWSALKARRRALASRTPGALACKLRAAGVCHSTNYAAALSDLEEGKLDDQVHDVVAARLGMESNPRSDHARGEVIEPIPDFRH
ncbi:hypothetical protein [Streptomyces sp. IMTB 2501]|uniref:hypothetical protein n=1 Tax=Streptomyces sp. IMTB 2501 TaxID=1776340 RepID=UPI00118118A2|nr:hypothetical protein [Streptomyces sp. IMTB 2501]